MPNTPVTAESIAIDANKPASASKDGQSAQAVSIPDKIAAAKFEAANATNGQGRKSKPRFTRVIPPGAS